ncbi:fimbrial protein [Amantichitinum ursilacus]|uniref:Fimbrial protein n=1 Tax=Amantichitinum ursilacus TaxID=857265 RepID=A0A0N0XIG4_9NEIS|nr:fimbrial protein [Amantichitinum ursilacus]KPC52881.1 Fimbrial protein [Amantichitinum ursilacus]
MKNKLARLIWVSGMCLLFSAKPALALICGFESRYTEYTQEINEQMKGMAVLDALPSGTELWRSPMYHVPLICTESFAQDSDDVVIYANPERVTPIPGVQFGIVYRGKTYWGGTGEQNSYGEMIMTYIYTNWQPQQANSVFQVGMTLDFQVIMRKNAAMIGAAVVDKYDVFSLGGRRYGFHSSTFGQVRKYTFTYRLIGLNGTKPSTCVPTVKTTPAVITFKAIAKPALEAGKQRVVPFSLDFSAQSCSAPLTVDVVFSSPNTDTTKTIIIPTDNTSVGITVREAGKGNIVMDTPITMLEDWSGNVISRPLEAVLSKQTSPVSVGAFNAVATVTMQYR